MYYCFYEMILESFGRLFTAADRVSPVVDTNNIIGCMYVIIVIVIVIMLLCVDISVFFFFMLFFS